EALRQWAADRRPACSVGLDPPDLVPRKLRIGAWLFHGDQQPQNCPRASVASFPLATSTLTSSSFSVSLDSVVTIRVESGDHRIGMPTPAMRARALAPGSVETTYVLSQSADEPSQ